LKTKGLVKIPGIISIEQAEASSGYSCEKTKDVKQKNRKNIRNIFFFILTPFLNFL
jgi:hypothetical protein